MIADELVFFNESEARTVDAIAARIIPGDDADPGAREAGAVVYIDQALAGACREFEKLYRRGLWELEHYCRARYGGSFVELGAERQDEVETPWGGGCSAFPARSGGIRPSRCAWASTRPGFRSRR